MPTPVLVESITDKIDVQASDTVGANVFVNIDATADSVSPVSAANVPATGVAMSATAQGYSVEVATAGQVYVKTGAAVPVDTKLKTDSQGRVIPVDPQDPRIQHVVAVSRMESSIAGKLILCELQRSTIQYGRGQSIVHFTEADSPVDLAALKTPHMSTISNKDATGQVVINLPPDAIEGTTFLYKCRAAQNMRIVPYAADAIEVNGALQGDGLYIEFDAIGEYVELQVDEDGNWVALSQNGTITVET